MQNPLSRVAKQMGLQKREDSIASLSNLSNVGNWAISEEYSNEEVETLDSKHAYIYSAVRAIAENVASTPITLYKNGERIDSHPALDVVKDPAEHLTSTQFKSSITKHLLLAGDCFIEIVRDKIKYSDGRVALRPSQVIPMIPPSHVQIVPGEDEFVDHYEYHGKGSEVLSMSKSEVAHLRFVSTSDQLYGLSPLQSLKQELATDEKAVSYNQKFFDSSAAPGGILSSEQRLNTEAKDDIQRRWNQNHQGVEQSHKVAVLGRGMEFQPIGLSQEDMQFVQTRDMTKKDIRALYGVPATYLGETEATYASAEEASKAFFVNVIIPMANRIAKALTKYILNVYWPNKNLRYDFNFLGSEALVPLVQEKAELQKTLITAGIPPNMATKMIWGQEFYDDDIGQTAFLPSTLVPMGATSTAVKDPGPQLSADTLQKSLKGDVSEEFIEQWRESIGSVKQESQSGEVKEMLEGLKKKLEGHNES